MDSRSGCYSKSGGRRQFTSPDFIGLLTKHQIAISMDGKGCWHDNVFIERLWKSVKYEEVRGGPENLNSRISGFPAL